MAAASLAISRLSDIWGERARMSEENLAGAGGEERYFAFRSSLA